MTIIALPIFEPGSDEWHEQRRYAVGGSEIAAVMQVSEWESHFALWHRKKGLIGPQVENDDMRWGKLLEEPIAQYFAQEHPDHQVIPGGIFTTEERPYQLFTPDRFVVLPDGTRRPLEIKKGSFDGKGWGRSWTTDIPIGYYFQCIWQMDGLGAEQCHLAVRLEGGDFREYLIDYNETDALILRSAAERFVASLRANERPDLDGHSATYEAVKELHPLIDGTDYPLPEHLARAFCLTRQRLEDAEADATMVRSQILDQMGNARRAMWDGKALATRQPNGPERTKLVASKNLPTFTQKAA